MANFCEYRTLYDLVNEDKPYEEFYSEMRLQYEKEFRRTGDLINQGQIRSLDTEMEFYRNRKPSFRVYPGMATALSMTDIDIPSGELHLPFSSFQIQLQPETFLFDPATIAPLTEIPLKGKPYLCSMLVCRRDINPFAKAKELHDSHALELYLDIRDSGNPAATIDSRTYVALLPGKTLKEGLEYIDVEQHFRIDRADQERMAALAVGVIFLAISRERKWVKRTRIKIKNADYCLCGSGKKYRKCCGPKTNTNAGDPIGFVVGKDIQLPYVSGSSTGVIVEGRGDELQYGHLRSGHMRWQWKNDPEGKRIRELIFIAPTVVRPDLPLKPQLTPRRTKPQPPETLPDSQRNPWAFAELPTDLRPVFYRNPAPVLCSCARGNPDEDLRALERRYQQTGAVADKAAYWNACLRIGTLPPVDFTGIDIETPFKKWVLEHVGEVQVRCPQPPWLVGLDTVGIRFYHPKIASEFPTDIDVVEGAHNKLHDEIAKRLELLIKEVGVV